MVLLLSRLYKHICHLCLGILEFFYFLFVFIADTEAPSLRMLQRRRCRCCVSCIIILVISISVFYFSSIRSISVNSYIDVSKYPDFRKYAKNIGETLDTVINRDDDEGNVLNGVPLRLLMKDGVDTPKYDPSKINGADKFVPRKSGTEEENGAHDVPKEGAENDLKEKSSKNYVNRLPPQLVVINGVNEKVEDSPDGKEVIEKVDQNRPISILNVKMSDPPNKDIPKDNAQVKGQEELDQETIAETLVKVPNKFDVKPTHIVIVTNRRSGSSFLGQIFNQNPDVFFHFEPLKVMEWKKEWYPNATNLIQNMMKCKFDDTPFLMEMYNHEMLHRESSKVLTSPPLCDLTKIHGRLKPVNFCPKLTNDLAMDVCKRYKHVVVKMIRMYSISSLEEVVRDPALNVKVIHLVRDPRGIHISRAKAEKKILTLGTELDKALQYICRRMKGNLDFTKSAPVWLEGKYIRVRYEELAENPTEWAQKLYNFTGLGMLPKEVQYWINANTQSSSGNAYSTQRNSAMTAQAWRKDVSFDIVQHMQDIKLCRPVLSELGYLEVFNEVELKNLSHSVVV